MTRRLLRHGGCRAGLPVVAGAVAVLPGSHRGRLRSPLQALPALRLHPRPHRRPRGGDPLSPVLTAVHGAVVPSPLPHSLLNDVAVFPSPPPVLIADHMAVIALPPPSSWPSAWGDSIPPPFLTAAPPNTHAHTLTARRREEGRDGERERSGEREVCGLTEKGGGASTASCDDRGETARLVEQNSKGVVEQDGVAVRACRLTV